MWKLVMIECQVILPHPGWGWYLQQSARVRLTNAKSRKRWWILSEGEVQAVILKFETYNFHRLDLTRQAGFIVTIYDEDGLRLAATMPCSTPAEAFREARKIVDNKVEGPGN
jgi:hypothetical protein